MGIIRGLPMFACVLFLGSVALGATKATAPPPTPESAEETRQCLSCHKEPDLEIDLSGGEILNVTTDPKHFEVSVHKMLACTDCHNDLKGKVNGHQGKGFPKLRDYDVWFSELCKQCHFDNYTKTLDSVHHEVRAKGNAKAALCVDCHGGHDMSRAAEPRSKISKTCATCHEKIAAVYTASVHGKAMSENNPDVPTCTDCHHSHDIADPRTGAWLLTTPQLCGSCHTNAEVMKKYELSTNVYSSYLADFHGATTLLSKGEGDARTPVALCTDCHGVHDITKVKDPNSKVIQANLVKTCQKCHPEATTNFPAAWLSHYEPTLEKAPLVFGVRVFYQYLIPFMIGGLVLQILLHLWRVVVNR